MKTNNGCTICGDPILADTENWDKPLCYEHYKMAGMKNKIEELRKELIQLKSDHDYLKPSTAIDLLDIIEKQYEALKEIDLHWFEHEIDKDGYATTICSLCTSGGASPTFPSGHDYDCDIEFCHQTLEETTEMLEDIEL